MNRGWNNTHREVIFKKSIVALFAWNWNYFTEATKQANNLWLVGQLIVINAGQASFSLNSSGLSCAVDVMWNENEASSLEIVLMIVVMHVIICKVSMNQAWTMTSQVTAYLLTSCVAFVKCVFKTLLLFSYYSCLYTDFCWWCQPRWKVV